jgi:4-amino-4-deoxychorismate lyase
MAGPDPDFQLFSSLRFDPVLLECKENSELALGPTPFYMLSHHRDRLLQAAEHFQWRKAIAQISGTNGLLYFTETLKAAIDPSETKSLRVKALLDHNGTITVETSETPKVPLENLFPARIPSPRSLELQESLLVGGATMAAPRDEVSGHGNPQQNSAWTILSDSVKTNPSSFTTYKTTHRDMYTNARARMGINSFTEPNEVLIISESDGEIMEGSLTSVFFWRSGRWVTPPISSGGQTGSTRRWLIQKGMCEEEVVRNDSLVDGEECWVSNGVRGWIWGRVQL